MTSPLITFLPYQRRWLEDQSRFKLAMFARQTGKSFTTCAEIVDDCIQAEIDGRRARWVILSRGERQAKEAMDEAIKPFAKAFWHIYRSVRGDLKNVEYDFKGGSGESYKALEVRFPGGSRITALPANPDTARGFSANVFLDEFAFHKDSREIWKALFPVVSKGGLKLRIASTPNGKGNKFYELWTGQDNVWSRHRVDIHQAVADGLDRDVDALRAALGDEDAWRQEYELEFLDEASAWLSYELITGAQDTDAGRPELYTGGPCFVGEDIAARSDLYVLWVLEAIGDVLWTREIIARQRISFAGQDALRDDVFRRYLVARHRMDQTGMGEKPVEDAMRRHGSARVGGVLFNPASKLHMATLIKGAFEKRSLRIPEGDAALRADLHKIKKVGGLGGETPRFVADSDSQGHADRFWALCLALAAAEVGPEAFGYIPVPSRHNATGRDDADALPRPVRASAGFRRTRW